MSTENVWLTSTLRELLHMPETTDADKETMGKLLLAAIDDITNASTALPSAELVQDVHAAIDGLITIRREKPSSESNKITCRKGCAHCCSQIVAISAIEAALLARAIRDNFLSIDMAKLERQQVRNDATWLELSPEDRTCVFLGEGNLCRVYDDRPASCRKYFSISDPSACDLVANPGGRTQVWFALNAEIVTSAMFTVSPTGFLPDLLLAELRRSHEQEAK